MKIKIEVPNGYFCKGCKMLIDGCDSQYDASEPHCRIYDNDLAYKYENSYMNPYKLPMCMEQLLNSEEK